MNLMLGAYPMIHHHQEKIVCHLLAAIAHCSRTDLLYILCLEACVLAVVISDNRKQSMIHKVTADGGYIEHAVTFANAVHQRASQGLVR